MANNISQDLIDELLVLSKDSSSELKNIIQKLIVMYNNEKKEHYLAQQRDKKKDRMLEQQSKMAAMGEMMDAVAHQWKQPLNALSMMSDMLQYDFDHGLVDKQYIEELTVNSRTQIDHMVNTLQEFRNFFRPDSEKKELFSIADAIESVQILMKDELLKNGVTFHTSIEDNLQVKGQKNQFKHLFINLISNSIDAFNEKNQKQNHLYLRAYKKESDICIEFEDNAGGVPSHVINDIFKPHVTTKKEGKGTGIGLYMSSQIVQKCNGTISVKNSDIGALFTITLHSLPTIANLNET